MTNQHDINTLLDATAFDASGNKLGSVNDVFINDRNGQPDFVDVNHGLFGMNSSIVPLRGHSLRDGELHLAFEKDRIKDAPELGQDGHLSATDRDSFYRHYQVNELEELTQYQPDRPAQSRTGEKRGVGGTVLDTDHADADRERVEAGNLDETRPVADSEPSLNDEDTFRYRRFEPTNLQEHNLSQETLSVEDGSHDGTINR